MCTFIITQHVTSQTQTYRVLYSIYKIIVFFTTHYYRFKQARLNFEKDQRKKKQYERVLIMKLVTAIC